MIHEGLHVIEDATGKYSSDKGWAMYIQGEIRAYAAELKAYEQYKKIPGNEDYVNPISEQILELWNDREGFKIFLETTYKPGWERLTGGE